MLEHPRLFGGAHQVAEERVELPGMARQRRMQALAARHGLAHVGQQRGQALWPAPRMAMSSDCSSGNPARSMVAN
jgi:hypothetical protein